MVDTQTTTVIVTYGHPGGRAHNIGRQAEAGIKVEYG